MFNKIKLFVISVWAAITKKKIAEGKTAEQTLDQVISIVNTVKTAVNSPVAAIITALIPTTIDDEIREDAVKALPVLLAGLTFTKGVIAGSPADADSATITAALAKVKLSDKPDQDAFYHSLAARLLVIISDGQVTWSEAVGMVEWYFKNQLKAN